MDYNAATPIVDGQTVIYAGAGRGTKAVKIEKTADGFAAKELWSNPDNGVQFDTPVLKGGQIYGVSQKGVLFCLDAKDGKTLWTTELGGRGFGSIVDAGSVLLALTPKGELTVFEPSDKEYKKVASYKVADDGHLRLPGPRRQRPVREGQRRRLVLDRGLGVSLVGAVMAPTRDMCFRTWLSLGGGWLPFSPDPLARTRAAPASGTARQTGCRPCA